MTALDMDHLRGWIGRESVVAEPLTTDIVRKFNATFGLGDAQPTDGDLAPLLIQFCLGQPAIPAAGLGQDGHPARGGFLPPVPLPRRMWAGGGVVHDGALKVGQTVTRRSVIEDVTHKSGRSGELCFVTVGHSYDGGEGVVIRETQDIVYRDAGGSGAATTADAPAPRGSVCESIDPTPTLLFRYSALTFNGHRIHYDKPYAMEVEGYPGLVVHGPMQATLLMQLATRIKGTPPRSFRFKSRSPLFDGTPMLINADQDGDGLRLWTARPGGPVAMTAEASW